MHVYKLIYIFLCVLVKLLLNQYYLKKFQKSQFHNIDFYKVLYIRPMGGPILELENNLIKIFLALFYYTRPILVKKSKRENMY